MHIDYHNKQCTAFSDLIGSACMIIIPAMAILRGVYTVCRHSRSIN